MKQDLFYLIAPKKEDSTNVQKSKRRLKGQQFYESALNEIRNQTNSEMFNIFNILDNHIPKNIIKNNSLRVKFIEYISVMHGYLMLDDCNIGRTPLANKLEVPVWKAVSVLKKFVSDGFLIDTGRVEPEYCSKIYGFSDEIKEKLEWLV